MAAFAVVGALLAIWLWHHGCMFPRHPFNELRLAPSFMLVRGLDIYPGPEGGPLTTWIYGPLPVLVFLPAVLASHAASALLIAGGINIAVTVLVIGVSCVLWPAPEGASFTLPGRGVAFLFCLAAWPGSSFQFLQADNLAVAFGLLSTLVLLRSGGSGSRMRWLSAAYLAAAVACKQTAVSLALAHLIWLWWRDGRQLALHQALRHLTCGLTLGAVLVGSFGWSGLWLNAVAVPAAIPPAPLADRLQDFLPLLLVHVGLPALLVAWKYREVIHPHSMLLLPVLCWAAALPAGLAGLFKLGGSINSLHGLLLALPATALAFSYRRRCPHRQLLLLLAVTALIMAVRLSSVPGLAWRPQTLHLKQAVSLTTQLPGEVWFPWNPLVSLLHDHRLDHVEDGLYVRSITGHAPSIEQIQTHLPPRWTVLAVPHPIRDWGLARAFCPADAEEGRFGAWAIWSWSAPVSID